MEVSDHSSSSLLGNSSPPEEGEALSYVSACDGICCSSNLKPYQPSSQNVLKTLARGGRNFTSRWFKQYPWLTVCKTTKKVYCFYCRYISNLGLLTFSKCCSHVFSTEGFNNWKKAIEKFNAHEASHAHREARMKYLSFGKPSLPQRLNTEVVRLQASRRKGLMSQLSCLKFLLRQGLAIRGHSDIESNLYQLMLSWSSDSNLDLKDWLKGKNICPTILSMNKSLL